MKNKQVARSWEFYRDNCQGFKEPMRQEFRKLDEYVSIVESENTKLREELEAVGTAGYLYGKKQLEEENAKLRRASERDADVMESLNLSLEETKAENAELRKFVQAVAEDVYGSSLFDCGGCRFHGGCYNNEEKEHKGRHCQWYTWSHELGIEVD